jgi:lipoprotein-anchoring transpeptidase ErfK/SrfK
LVKRLIALGFLTFIAASADARPVMHPRLSVMDRAARLGSGQYVWNARVDTRGPVFLVIDLSTQRALLFRNGALIAVSTVSTGRRGRGTPTGVFTVLQKQVRHRSRTYDDAPMPYMERLTWKGVAMHAGHVAGHPASHGCIRLPWGFAKLLYGVTRLGTPVIIKA